MSRERDLTRRGFLGAALATTAAALGAGGAAGAEAQEGEAQGAAASGKQEGTTQSTQRDAGDAGPAAGVAGTTAETGIATRPLGRTGLAAPIIAIGGAMQNHGPALLDYAWEQGIRYYDTAAMYSRLTANRESEGNIAQMLRRHPERRERMFLVTKDHRPGGQPRDFLAAVDARLKACGTEYIDLFFMHALGPGDYGEGSLEWFRQDETREVAEALKRAGKVRAFGFSTHDEAKARYLKAAAEGGYIDGIMFAYSPFLAPGDELLEAIGACHAAGIGLIAMKVQRAHGDVPKRVPDLEKRGLTTYQALLQATWSDARMTAACLSMDNEQHVREAVEAARGYREPLPLAALEEIGEAVACSAGTICPNCDGRCGRAAGAAGLPLADIARYVNYYERDGMIAARECYREVMARLAGTAGVTAAQNGAGLEAGRAAAAAVRAMAAGADLAAARRACPCHLDFARLIERAEKYFG